MATVSQNSNVAMFPQPNKDATLMGAIPKPEVKKMPMLPVQSALQPPQVQPQPQQITQPNQYVNQAQQALSANIPMVAPGKYDTGVVIPTLQPIPKADPNIKNTMNTVQNSLMRDFNNPESFDSVTKQVSDFAPTQTANWADSLLRAKDTVNPVYDERIGTINKQMDNRDIRSGFFGQMPAEALKRETMVQEEAGRTRAINESANSFMDREQTRLDNLRTQNIGIAQNALNYAMQKKQGTVNSLMDAVKAIAGEDQRNIQNIFTEAGLTLEDAKLRLEKAVKEKELGMEDAKYLLSLKKMQTDNMVSAAEIGMKSDDLQLKKEDTASNIATRAGNLANDNIRTTNNTTDTNNNTRKTDSGIKVDDSNIASTALRDKNDTTKTNNDTRTTDNTISRGKTEDLRLQNDRVDKKAQTAVENALNNKEYALKEKDTNSAIAARAAQTALGWAAERRISAADKAKVGVKNTSANFKPANDLISNFDKKIAQQVEYSEKVENGSKYPTYVTKKKSAMAKEEVAKIVNQMNASGSLDNPNANYILEYYGLAPQTEESKKREVDAANLTKAKVDVIKKLEIK